ncbi:MAG: hypothetical protein LBS42_11255 [Tannerella sp.]|jgi:hypothetical protein|nr:hypothetical protein [Tannerella sp.]
MSSKDYLPKAYVALLNWLLNFVSYVAQNIQRFGIPTSKFETLQKEIGDFQSAQTKAEHPNAGKADRLEREELAKAVSKALRYFVNVNLRYNENVTDQDRVNMGLTVPDTTPTTPPAPSTQPVVTETDSSIIMRITLHYKDSKSASKAKPYGIHGVEIRWAILDGPPVTTADLMNSEFSTRSFHTFVFEENQRGKTVWFRLRWENTRGEKGPWSELYSAIIP